MTIDPAKAHIDRAIFARSDVEAREELATAARLKAGERTLFD